MDDPWQLIRGITILVFVSGLFWICGRSLHGFAEEKKSRDWSFKLSPRIMSLLATRRVGRVYLGPLLAQVFGVVYLLVGGLVLTITPSAFETFSAWYLGAALLVFIVYMLCRDRLLSGRE